VDTTFPYEKGLSSSDLLLSELSQAASTEPTKFWWCLLDSVIENENRAEQQERLREILNTGIRTLNPSLVKEKLLRQTRRRVLLIDGVETAFDSGQMASFVEGLFRFLAAVQSDIAINQILTIRLFIRTDLAEGARENVEQQTENRAIYLAWNTQSILNFVMVRMGSLPWFRATFHETVQKIEACLPDLVKGSVVEDDCNQLLLDVFPIKLRRNNLLTLTFLKTYFSDGQGDKASFYPRIYDSFLKYIANGGLANQAEPPPQLENGRIRQGLIFDAHDYACKDYLKQVRDELKNLVSLADDPTENQQRISDLLDGFGGMKTPFIFEECAHALSGKLYPKIDVSIIRRAMSQMKRVGIFEDRPDYPGYWRVGRLFKSSLGMRYQR
jgi:hypothetical protein